MIFAKAPEPGRVKTRLAPALGVEGAAHLHAALLADVVERHQRPGRRVTVWRAGDLAHPIWAELGVPLATQPDGDLGDRQRAAFAAESALALMWQLAVLRAAPGLAWPGWALFGVVASVVAGAAGWLLPKR